MTVPPWSVGSLIFYCSWQNIFFFFSLSFSFRIPFSTYPGSLLGTWLSSHHAHPVVVCIKWAICAFNIRKWSYAAELIVFTCGTAISFEPLSHLLLQFSWRRSLYGEDATGIITWIDQQFGFVRLHELGIIGTLAFYFVWPRMDWYYLRILERCAYFDTYERAFSRITTFYRIILKISVEGYLFLAIN